VVAERNAIGGLLVNDCIGPTPIEEALRHFDEHSNLEALYPERLGGKAGLVARLGRFDEARDLVERGRRLMEERGLPLAAQTSAVGALDVELVAGDYAAAEGHARFFCQQLEEQGAHAFLSTYVCLLGRCLCGLGRYDEALECAERGRELSAPDDALTQTLWRRVEATVRARRGDFARAERLARDAVAAIEDTGVIDLEGEAWADLGAVLALAGKNAEAATAYEQARTLFARKGNVVAQGRVEAQLESLANSVS
jgi:tetratricopeptide (TPR) repeat protein